MDSLGIDVPREELQSVHIALSAERVWIDFRPPLADGPHKMTRVETMAAAALVGIARALTGRGEAEVMRALEQFEATAKRKKR